MSTTTKYRHMVTSYAEDMALFRTGIRKFWFAFLLAALAVLPFLASSLGGNYLAYLLNLVGIATIVTLGLNFLVGNAGLVSIGHSAFLAVGAYTAAFLANEWAFPFWMTITISGVVTGLVGFVVGLPAVRLKGIYLAFVTLAFQFIVGWVVLRWEAFTGGANGVSVPPPALGRMVFSDPVAFYYLTATVAICLGLGMANLMRSKYGRALVAVRDSDVAAEAIGVHLARAKTLAFGVSAAFAGVAGSLMAHFLGYIGPDHFTILVSIEYLAMIVLGGMGTILGSVLGAVVITLLPEALRVAGGTLAATSVEPILPDLRALMVGLLLILMLVFEPEGLAGRWTRIRRYWTTWPF